MELIREKLELEKEIINMLIAYPERSLLINPLFFEPKYADLIKYAQDMYKAGDFDSVKFMFEMKLQMNLKN